MNNKANIGKVLLSLVIAMTMLVPLQMTNATPPPESSVIPVIVPDNPTPPVTPTLPLTLFTDGFAVWPGVWTVGDWNADLITWYQGLTSSDGDGFCAEFATSGGDLDSVYLLAGIDLTTYVPGLCTFANAWLEFDYMTDSAAFYYSYDAVNYINLPAAPSWTHMKVALPVGGIVYPEFFEDGAEVGRFAYVDNVTVWADMGFVSDIVINGLVNINDDGKYPIIPYYVEVNITNEGTEYAYDVDFHLQVYKEVPYEPEPYICWDMESCILNTWYAVDGNHDGVTWSYTEKRSHSPTHSFHTQPDWLTTYEAYSFDSLLLQEPFCLPTEVEGRTVSGYVLSFWHWLDGEGIYDYGTLTISNINDSTTITQTYTTDTAGWQQVNVTIPASWFGDCIMINFTWIADAICNYEGWYIDDVCIEVTYGSAQPLVDQGYKYIDVIAPGETILFQFPLTYEFEPGTYFLQVYSDYVDCNPGNPMYPNWADEINYTVWFGDQCDAAICSVDVSAAEYEMPDSGIASVPITVCVYNNGTLIEDVPVEVRINRQVVETLYFNDVEGITEIPANEQGYSIGYWNAGVNTWHVTTADFYSPYQAIAMNNPATNHIGAGTYAYFTPFADNDDGTPCVDWNAYLNDPNFDINWMSKWRVTTGDWPLLYWHIVNTNYLFGRTRPMYAPNGYGTAQNTWTEMSAKWLWHSVASPAYLDIVQPGSGYLYGTAEYPDTLMGLAKWMTVEYAGATWPDDFGGMGYAIAGPSYAPGGTVGDPSGTWSGILFDDYKISTSYAGEEVYSTTYTFEDVIPQDPCVCTTLWWNQTEYCDYIATGEIMLDCDEDETNNVASSDPFRIYEQIYTNETEGFTTDDNTYGLDDDWFIVEECSWCPADHFWYNAIDLATQAYDNERNDVLEMVPYKTIEPFNNTAFVNVTEGTFDFTTVGVYELMFDTWYDTELYFDYCIVEISNDSGLNWYPVYEMTGTQDWTTVGPLVLYDPALTGICQNPNPLPDLWAPFPVPPIGATDEMMIRFNFLSDGATTAKGILLDNIGLYFNGNALFYDDMETGEAKWRHMYEYTGSVWHEVTPGHWANFDTYYSWYNLNPNPATGWYSYDETDVGLYRNQEDDKLIIANDVKNAYQCFITWEQNYDFTGMYPNDYGIVEVWTGTEWKALFIVQGGTGGTWQPMSLDISTYVNHAGLTQVRFRMMSNDTLVGAGWQIRNVSKNGKIDNTDPTVACAISPATPNGNCGWWKTPVTFTATATDNVKVEAIYYRIDGGAWKLYTGPITINIDGTHTVEAYSVDEVGNVSPICSSTFKIDATAPTQSITAPAAGYIYLFGRQLFANPLGGTVIIGGMTFAGTATDATSGMDYVSFQIGDNIYQRATTPYEVYWNKFDLLPTSYTVTMSCYDIAGNKGADQTLTFKHWL